MTTLTKTKAEKTHWKKNFNYDYLGAYSLPEGKDIVVTIKSIKKEKITGTGGKKEECTVCYFNDSDKPMILNKTNCKIISKVYGTPYMEEWVGLKIQLFSAKVDAWGDTTEALRVRDFKPTEEVDNTEALSILNRCSSLTELQQMYLGLPKNMQADKEVIALKNKLKGELR